MANIEKKDGLRLLTEVYEQRGPGHICFYPGFEFNLQEAEVFKNLVTGVLHVYTQ